MSVSGQIQIFAAGSRRDLSTCIKGVLDLVEATEAYTASISQVSGNPNFEYSSRHIDCLDTAESKYLNRPIGVELLCKGWE